MTDVLDHGYVSLVSTWGTDEGIIEAARMSTGKGFQGWGELRCRCGATSRTARWDAADGKVGRLFHDAGGSRCPAERGGAHVAVAGSESGDEKLLRYLWLHKHATPFEMAGMIVEVQAPIFVFREWHRHRTQSYNELSARYTQMPDVHYVPAPERVRAQDRRNRQATGGDALPPEVVAGFLAEVAEHQRMLYAAYERYLAAGIPRELARINTPVSRYSRMRVSANLRNWLAFLALRLDRAAQEEIRLYAQAVGNFVAERFPRTWELFAEGLNA